MAPLFLDIWNKHWINTEQKHSFPRIAASFPQGHECSSTPAEVPFKTLTICVISTSVFVQLMEPQV